MASHENFPVIFDGEHYDIKKFLRDHPGGVNTLNLYKGKSIVDAMKKFEHSTGAYHIMKDFKVSGDEANVLIRDVNLTGDVSANRRIITNGEVSKNDEEIKFLEDLEGRLDWSKPLLCQLDAIAPHYDTWVNTPVYKKCRIFASPLLEGLTYTPWYVVPIFWIPIILYLGITQFMQLVACKDGCKEVLSNLQYVQQIVQGILLWTAIEYILHRWVFHLNPGSSLTMIKIHFLFHGLHHKVPFDGLRQVFPPVPALFLATIIYNLILPFMRYPEMKLMGALIGYLIYDMIHYYVHHGSPRDGTYLYEMKRYHSNHHFINHDKAFGISSKLWDYVFKTIVNVKRLGFSLRW